MGEFAAAVFDSLEVMDREATTVRDGYETGLYWYGGHARPEQKKPQTEPNWTQALAKVLPSVGYPSRAEVPYPDQPRQKCDLVVDVGGNTVWIEIKGAFQRYWLEKGNEYFYRSYLLHPLVRGLDPKSHTAPLDLDKLSRLSSEDADSVGLLLVGFDTSRAPMDADIAELTRLAQLDRDPWCGWSRTWDDPHRAEGRTRCWFWLRPA